MLKRQILISVVWVGFFVLCAMPAFAQDLLWCRTYADGGEESGNSVQQTADGGYIIAGWTDHLPLGRVVYLIKTDSRGDTLWARTYSGIYPAEGYSVQQTKDGGYIVAGMTVFSNDTPPWTSVYLVRTDSLGDALWSRTYGVGDYYLGRSVQQTTDGGYIVAGQIYDLYAFLLEVYLIRTDSLGDTLWTRTYGGSNWEEGYSVQQSTDGGYVVTGYTESFGAGGSDVYLIKTDAYGDTLWTRTYGGVAVIGAILFAKPRMAGI